MLKELAAEFPDLPEEMYRLIMLAAHFAEGRVPERPGGRNGVDMDD